MRALRVCQVAAEVTPFAKTGGLGDVVAGLSRFLGREGHDVRIFLPWYRQLAAEPETYLPVDFIRDVPLRIGSRHFTFTARTCKLPASAVDVYFVDCPALYGSPGIYQGDRLDWLRFAFLTRAALECAQRMGWGPDVVHCHDWHTALAPLFLKTLYSWDRLFDTTRSVLTLHNVAYQGVVDRSVAGDLDLAPYVHWLDGARFAAGEFNFLRTGLLHADALTAVSRTFAREIQTPEQGFGVDDLLRARADRLFGIVNGVDYGDWDPATDPHLPHSYSAADLAGKAEMKRALLAGVGLEPETAAPVLGIVSRLTAQKGFDLCFTVLPDLLASLDVRLVVLGSGEERYERFFQELARQFPGKASFYRGYNEPLAHWIEAGADLFLMPSRFEPCGLNQMYSLRYGTPPVVHRTGGLADTVEPWDPGSGTGTGFLFDRFHPDAFAWALRNALVAFQQGEGWGRLMQNGMARNFSWDVQGKEYVELYRRFVG
ncbi:MAG TPA: glycogen synthase [Thermoanaerobaculia bacterium]|nr:glycogen synthase [Thermoanaerobaculia bacterium]